jgi:hypothetical protein
MIKPNLLIKLILCFAVLVYSCKNKKRLHKTENAAVAPSADTINNKCKLDFKTARALSKYVKENEFNFVWLTAKANVESNIEGKEESFDIKLSIKKDSAMLLSIRYILGLEVAKALITKDSIKFVNYIGKNYFKGDFNYINDMLNADLDFDLLQAILFGNSAEFSEEDSKLKPVTDRQNCHYLLSTERKRRLRKIQSGGEIKDAMQTLTLNPDNFKILINEFIDPLTNRSFVVNYSNFTAKDSVFAPYHVDIDIVAQKKASIKIEYVRIEKNTPQKLSIHIPAKYDQMQIQKK